MGHAVEPEFEVQSPNGPREPRAVQLLLELIMLFLSSQKSFSYYLKGKKIILWRLKIIFFCPNSKNVVKHIYS